MANGDLCDCGCGKKLKGKANKKFYNRKCYQDWYRKNKDTIKENEFCLCGCGKKLIGSQTKWSSVNCRSKFEHHKNYKAKNTTLAGNQYGKLKRGITQVPKKNKVNIRADYCHQDWRECVDYDECQGKKHSGDCFKPEELKESSGSNFTGGRIAHTKQM